MNEKKKEKMKYYSLDAILKYDADYYVGFGMRSNGKSFSVKDLILFGYHKNGIDINGYLDDASQGGLIRRYETDFQKGRGATMFDDIVYNENLGYYLNDKTKGKWNGIKYYSYAWYLVKRDGEDELIDDTPFCYAFALNSEEHYKSNQYPKIKNAFLDEFIARDGYLNNEFMAFTSILSTIIRDRDNVKIFLMGNSVNKVNPYFIEMGLYKAKSMKVGTIDLYTYGESGLRVAVEYTDFPAKKKKSDKYFAFENPKLKMITTGEWELDIYPHLPYKYLPKEIYYTYFIKFYGELFQCEIINKSDMNIWFTYIHRKTTPIKENEESIIYQEEYDARSNYKRKIIYALSNIEKTIVWFFKNDKVFYQDNEVGDMINNYIEWCRNSK